MERRAPIRALSNSMPFFSTAVVHLLLVHFRRITVFFEEMSTIILTTSSEERRGKRFSIFPVLWQSIDEKHHHPDLRRVTNTTKAYPTKANSSSLSYLKFPFVGHAVVAVTYTQRRKYREIQRETHTVPGSIFMFIKRRCCPALIYYTEQKKTLAWGNYICFDGSRWLDDMAKRASQQTVDIQLKLNWVGISTSLHSSTVHR